MSAERSWSQVAASLGLTAVGDGAEGMWEGQRVRCYYQALTASTYACGVLARPFDLRLYLGPRARGGTPHAGSRSPHPLRLGDGEIDDEMSIFGDEPERVKALFTPELRRQVVAMYSAPYEFEIDDTGCAVWQWGDPFADEPWLAGALHEAAAAVARMEEARAGVPPSRPFVRHGETLRALASARGLGWWNAPMLVTGRAEGSSIAVGSAHGDGRAHHLFASTELDIELGFGLSIRRARLLDGLGPLLNHQDILVGDAEFDRRFVVRAAPERADRVAGLIDSDVRAGLIAIDAEAGAVELDDRHVHVRPIPADFDPSRLPWLFDTLSDVAGRISRNLLHGGVEAGPYR